MAIFDKLKEVIIETLEIDDDSIITPEASFADDLKADSLDQVQLIMEIEKKFGVEIPDEDTEKIVTVQDVIDYLESKR